MKRSAEEAALLDVVDRRAMIPAAPLQSEMTEDTDTAAPHRVSMIPLSTSSTTTALSSSSTTPSLMSSRLSSSSLSSSNNDVRTFTRFINARLLQRDGSLNMGTLNVDSATGIITQITFDSQQTTAAAAADSSTSVGGDDDQIVDTVDCRGMILSPGFIDLQLNGAYGVDFSNGDCSEEERGDDDGEGSNNGGLCTEDIMRVANSLCQTGCTSFCPTMVSSSCHTYRRVLPLMRKARKQQQQQRQMLLRQGVVTNNGTKIGASILGMHLEGPFFDPTKRGAHDERHILAPSQGIDTVREVYGLTREDQNVDNESSPILKDIDIITLAPELDGGLKATKSLTSSGVVVSCGHTGATYEQGIEATTHGATLLTHLFNAMNPFHHRKPGLVGLLSSETKLANLGFQRPFYSLIVDGIHVHESAVCMAYSSHPEGCVLVTDAMSAMGLGDGKFDLGNMSVTIKGDRATLTDTETLAGAVVSMDKCVRRFQKFTGCTVGEALLCATIHPANVLSRGVTREGTPPIGVLEVGAIADLTLVTDQVDVVATWVHGRLAYGGLKI